MPIPKPTFLHRYSIFPLLLCITTQIPSLRIKPQRCTFPTALRTTARSTWSNWCNSSGSRKRCRRSTERRGNTSDRPTTATRSTLASWRIYYFWSWAAIKKIIFWRSITSIATLGCTTSLSSATWSGILIGWTSDGSFNTSASRWRARSPDIG